MAFPSPYGPQPGNQFGAGSLSAGTSGLTAAAGGLGNMRGVPSGRSGTDLQRMMEQTIRRNRSQGNYGAAFQTAVIGNNVLREQQKDQAGWSEIGKLYQNMTGQQPAATPGQPQNPAQTLQGADISKAGWGMNEANTGDRSQNIAAAKQAGTFNAIVDRYNQAAKGSGKMMDASGNIVDAPAPGATPAVTTTPNPAAPGNKMVQPIRELAKTDIM